MSKIHALYALACACSGETKDQPDKVNDEIWMAVWHLKQAVLKLRAQSRADLEIKIALWTDLIGDPACILDVHQEHWRTMMADFTLFMHAAEHPERYPELKEAS
ncbi:MULTISPECIES: hypothetical protein [Brucella]|uniref:hypothetical protein n=1 Tax=Brucella TaxID=234 RepID=UPI00124C5572|nr:MULTISPECIES: hypothetical protein [Brucella]KAB2684740.1 hypothetical protein F9K78_03980 [Brucella pseudintermedia]MCO7738983.1 hypothetical protein [Brucella intermedia]